jgi:hypothetical protein
VVAAQPVRGLPREAAGARALALPLPGQEGLGQRQHVLAPLAQRGQGEGHHAQAVVEVLAERPGRHGLAQVLAGRGDEPHVHLDGARAAQSLEAALLDDAQELRLERGLQVVHLVEVEGAAVGQLDLARLGLAGVGEGALLVPEQLRLQQVLGDRGAMDLQERPVAPRPAVVDEVREQVLAGTALALDQHGAGDGGQAGGDLQHLLHGRRHRHHPRQAFGRGHGHPLTSCRRAPPQSRSRS